MNTTPDNPQDAPESGQKKLHYFWPIRYEVTFTHKSSRRLRSAFSDKAMKRRERRKAIKQSTYKLNRK